MRTNAFSLITILTVCIGCGQTACFAGTPETLEQRVRRQDISSFRQAAAEGRRDLIPVLEEYAELAVNPLEPVRTEAKLALAKLGNKKYLAEIIAELTTTNSPAFQAELDLERRGGLQPTRAVYVAMREIRSRAFKKLAYINDPSTTKTIASFLYDTEDPNLDPGKGDAVYETPAQLAVRTLRNIVKNAPQSDDIATWQQWWEQNKDKYP